MNTNEREQVCYEDLCDNQKDTFVAAREPIIEIIQNDSGFEVLSLLHCSEMKTHLPIESREKVLVEMDGNRENRIIFDEEIGMYFDNLSGFHYEKESNLYYLFPREKTTILGRTKRRKLGKSLGYKCFHWNNEVQQYWEVLENGQIFYPRKKQIKKVEEEEEQEEEIELTEEEKTSCGTKRREMNGKYPLENSTGEQLELEMDPTSQYFFEKRSGLYYQPLSDLFCDLRMFPPRYYHWNYRTRAFMHVCPLLEETPLEEDNENKVQEVPSQCLLVLLPTGFDTDATNNLENTNITDNNNNKNTREEDAIATNNTSSSSNSSISSMIEKDKSNSQVTATSLVSERGKWFLIGEGAGRNENESNAHEMIITIGRDKQNTIVVPNLEVSKFHAKIVWKNLFFENFYWLQDLGSRNGTFLNGVRLSDSRVPSEPNTHSLKLGDILDIAGTLFKVYRTDDPTLFENGLFDQTDLRSNMGSSLVPFPMGPVLDGPSLAVSSNRELRRTFRHTRQERALIAKTIHKYSDRAAWRRELYQQYSGPDPEPEPEPDPVREKRTYERSNGRAGIGYRAPDFSFGN